MALKLPVRGVPSDSFEISLSEEVYNISLRWVNRTSSWYLAIELADVTGIVNFEKITPLQSIVNFNTQILPNGKLFVLPQGGTTSELLGRNNFGSLGVYKLVYLTNEDLVDYIDLPTFEGWFLA